MSALPRMPLLVVDDPRDRSTLDAMTVSGLIEELATRGMETRQALGLEDAAEMLRANPAVGGVLVVWDHTPLDAATGGLRGFAETVRGISEHLPLFILTGRSTVGEIPPGLHAMLTGCLWAGEDDIDFLAGHIFAAMAQYRQRVLPPFFGALVDYVAASRQAWHTPGHMGGVAFLKTPVGRIFHDFFGENVLRADLSSSVSELGSVLEHGGVVAAAERAAAHTFGADETYFVTNGTTMSNQIIFRSVVSRGDVVLLDRNCHKSIVNSVIQTGAIPIYMSPMRNRHGMIGPIDPTQLGEVAVRTKLLRHPLIEDMEHPIRLAVVTNSTYDGTMYDTAGVLARLGNQVDFVLFDEAWIPYAAFHPIFAGHFAMSNPSSESGPTVFATMSNHKMLAAFSQASMIHIRQGHTPASRQVFNEAFMMHTSTSPQYNIVASLDVSAKMMEGAGGRTLMDNAIGEALDFRQEMTRLARLRDRDEDWWFEPWQPPGSPDATGEHWVMTDRWTGFQGLAPGYAMLDPTKVSLLCPGMEENGGRSAFGVPAAIVSSLLREQGVVAEKTGFYSILFLFSIGVTRGKSASLVEALMEVKQQIDENLAVEGALPAVFAAHPDRYRGLGVQDLARQMHAELATADIGAMQEAIYKVMPEPAMTPGEAFDALIRGRTHEVPVDKLEGCVSAVLCVLYPPGIPVVMPGETFTEALQPIARYLQLFERWDGLFPGFETEMQGVVKHAGIDGRFTYAVPCVEL